MLTLRGPSTHASYYFIVPPEGKSCIQACSSAAGPGARCFQPGGLQGQPVPHRSSPQPCPPPHPTLCPHGPGICSPTSLRCPLQPRDGSAQIPPPARSHGLGLLSASPQAPTLPRQEPQQAQPGEAQSSAPGEGQPQPPAHRITESQNHRKGTFPKGAKILIHRAFFFHITLGCECKLTSLQQTSPYHKAAFDSCFVFLRCPYMPGSWVDQDLQTIKEQSEQQSWRTQLKHTAVEEKARELLFYTATHSIILCPDTLSPAIPPPWLQLYVTWFR